MLVLHQLLCRLVMPVTAMVAVVIAALATPVRTVSADWLWTHGPAQLLLLVGVGLGIRRRWGLEGLAYGAAILMRPHRAVVPLVMGLWHAYTERRFSITARVGAGSFAGLVALNSIVYQHAISGRWSVLGGYGARHLNPDGVGLTQLPLNVLVALVSPQTRPPAADALPAHTRPRDSASLARGAAMGTPPRRWPG
jgi:hypothetical protein